MSTENEIFTIKNVKLFRQNKCDINNELVRLYLQVGLFYVFNIAFILEAFIVIVFSIKSVFDKNTW